MVPHTGWIRLDHDDVEAKAELRERAAVRQRPGRDDRPGGVAEVTALAEVDRLLGQPERPARPEANLDEHQARRRARVDRHEIELVATDMDVPGQDRPAGLGQPLRDEGLGIVAGSLGPRAAPSHRLAIHGAIVAGGAYLAVTSRSSRRQRRMWTLVNEPSIGGSASRLAATLVARRSTIVAGGVSGRGSPSPSFDG